MCVTPGEEQASRVGKNKQRAEGRGGKEERSGWANQCGRPENVDQCRGRDVSWCRGLDSVFFFFFFSFFFFFLGFLPCLAQSLSSLPRLVS